jgi:hypothetical protein
VVDVAVHVAVREQADEMDHAPSCAFTIFRTGDDLLPRFAAPDGAFGDGVGNQRGALAIDLPGADGVVPDFGVAHIVVGRHADGGAVGTQADIRIVGEQAIERRLAGGGNGTADVGLGQAVAVHDDDDDRPRNSGKGGEFG